MKAKEIETLRETSREVCRLLPGSLSVDSEGRFLIQGKRIDAFELMTQLTNLNKIASELNTLIQRIKGKEKVTKP